MYRLRVFTFGGSVLPGAACLLCCPALRTGEPAHDFMNTGSVFPLLSGVPPEPPQLGGISCREPKPPRRHFPAFRPHPHSPCGIYLRDPHILPVCAYLRGLSASEGCMSSLLLGIPDGRGQSMIFRTTGRTSPLIFRHSARIPAAHAVYTGRCAKNMTLL